MISLTKFGSACIFFSGTKFLYLDYAGFWMFNLTEYVLIVILFGLYISLLILWTDDRSTSLVNMRGRSYSPSPPRGYGRRGRSPSPRGVHYGGRGRDEPTTLLVRNLRHDCRYAFSQHFILGAYQTRAVCTKLENMHRICLGAQHRSEIRLKNVNSRKSILSGSHM